MLPMYGVKNANDLKRGYFSKKAVNVMEHIILLRKWKYFFSYNNKQIKYNNYVMHVVMTMKIIVLINNNNNYSYINLK
jgi:hypothetical protein